ncbi:hypothetical protein ACH5RR_023388 [Cinchona calisaya]|uniref:Uncharacterized protein n=1 Tax=Cinchona calisaya TaxID=153742 RepID=A0ABD2ZAH9_9GENT
MDSSSDDETAMIIGAATSALAAGYAVLEAYRTPIVIPRPPHINRDQARENYMDSILYGSSSYCIDQIRMDQDTFFRLLNSCFFKPLLIVAKMKNPSHDKFIHKKIDFYDEMALVVGKDMATGSFGKTFTDINLGAPLTVDDAVNNITELVMQKEIPYSNASSSETNTSSCGAKQHRKRNRSSDEIEKISERLGEVAAALCLKFI